MGHREDVPATFYLNMYLDTAIKGFSRHQMIPIPAPSVPGLARLNLR